MTWSYSGDPSSTPKDQLRFTIGDTIESDPLLTDEEILACVAQESTELGAAARCCEAIALKYARLCNTKLGPQDKSYAQKYEHYSREARRLRKRACATNAPTAGGISISDSEAIMANTDAKLPIFSRDMMSG